MSIYSQLLKDRIPYNETLIRRSIIVIKNSSVEKTINKHKTFIYRSLANIIIKNVNNFFNLIKDVDKTYIIHEKDDIVVECYLTLDRCIYDFKLEYVDKNFYFYVNRALNLGLFRMQKQQYNRDIIFNQFEFNDVSKYEKNTFVNNTHPLLLSKNFTDREILLMQSKIEEEKIEDFCKKIEITRNEYYRLLKSIKSKMKNNF